MRAAWVVFSLVGVSLLVAGCPNGLGAFVFTSADIAGGGGLRTLGGTFDDALDADAEGDGATETRTVVEPDVIRRDGNLLYVLNQFRGLMIVDLDSDTILGRAPTFGFPRDLYLVGDQAYVLVGLAQEFEALENDTVAVSVTSRLYVIDVADPEAPTIESSFDIEGDLVDSRLVGDVLYAVTGEYAYFGFAEDGVAVDVAALKQNSTSYVTSIDLADPANISVVDELQFDGAGQVIHVTPTEAFVAVPDYGNNTTAITVVDISDPGGAIALRGTTSVAGYVADRFKLDAWNGTLRVVSSQRGVTSEVIVSTIDLATLTPIQSLRLDEASGDSLFATRFDGPLAYIVTYFVVDPLFVVDLSDPANPAVRAPLTIPGFSIHIEPRGDRLIALGVDDTDGVRRVGVSLFDVSGDPVRLDHVSFGEDWSWSNAFNDVKAFTVLDDTIITPFSGWSGDAGGYERLQFLSYTRDTLEMRGHVDLDGTIVRSFDYGDGFFGVTTEQLARIEGPSLDELAVVSTVTLAENIVDFAEIAPGLGVEIVSRYDDGATVVRGVDGDLNEISAVELELGSFAGLFARDDSVVVIGTVFDESSHYEVAVVDVSTEGALTLRGQVSVDIAPFYPYYYYGGPVAEIGFASDALFAPWPGPFNDENRSFLIGDDLLLRGYGGETDVRLGSDDVTEVLARVNIETVTWERTIGLGYERVASLDRVGDLLYLGTKRTVSGLNVQPLCAFYVQTLDPIAETLGEAVNVPGRFVDYDPATDVLVLQDFQWDPFAYLDTTLQTVRWDGTSDPIPLDSLTLADSAGELVAVPGALYYASYDRGLRVNRVDIDADGNFGAASDLLITESWGGILGAEGDNLYVTIGSGAIARYAFDDGFSLGEVQQVMGAPLSLRFGADAAYAPLGYYGIAVLNK